MSLALDLFPSPHYYYWYYFISIPSILSRTLSFLPSLPLFLLLFSILSFCFPFSHSLALTVFVYFFILFSPIPHLDFPSFSLSPYLQPGKSTGFSGTPVLGSPDRGPHLFFFSCLPEERGRRKNPPLTHLLFAFPFYRGQCPGCSFHACNQYSVASTRQ